MRGWLRQILRERIAGEGRREDLATVLYRRRPPPVLSPARQRAALADIARRGVELQLDADRVVVVCGQPGPVAGWIGRDGAEVLLAYYRLREELAAVAVDAPLAEVRDRLDRQLYFHLWMLREALQFALGAAPTERCEEVRARLTGLGRTADELRAIRVELAAEPGA